jgi:hypothetical protein
VIFYTRRLTPERRERAERMGAIIVSDPAELQALLTRSEPTTPPPPSSSWWPSRRPIGITSSVGQEPHFDPRPPPA